MLDAYIIDRLRKEREEQERARVQQWIERPPPMPEIPERPRRVDPEKPRRGSTEIDFRI